MTTETTIQLLDTLSEAHGGHLGFRDAKPLFVHFFSKQLIFTDRYFSIWLSAIGRNMT